MKQTINERALANQSSIIERIALLEMANRIGEFFENRSARAKRRLLNFVLSNSI